MNDLTTVRAAAGFDELIELRKLAVDVFATTAGGPPATDMSPGVYGGEIVAQALYAAGQSVDASRVPHSMQAYFTSFATRGQAVVFEVERVRDGNGFSSRRVAAWQGGVVVCTLSASFVVDGHGGWHDQGAPFVAPRPPAQSQPLPHETLLSFEGRDPGDSKPNMQYPQRFWARCHAALPPTPLAHASALVYVSDVISGSPAAPDGCAQPSFSLDHAMWFHQPSDVSQWQLVDLDHVWTGHGRTFFDGRIFTESGQLVASLAKEELFRRPATPGSGGP